MEGAFNLDLAKFNKLFPFHIVVDEFGNINSIGKSLEKVFPIAKGTTFNSQFVVKRPSLISPDFEDFSTICNNVVILGLQSDHTLVLRGQFELLDNPKRALFVGTPWFGSMTQVVNKNLTIHDFAIHDPMIDLLHVLKTQEITTEDIKQLLKKVNHQKEILRKDKVELERLSLVAKANTNGVLLISKDGLITWCNEGFTKLTGYEESETVGQYPFKLLNILGKNKRAFTQIVRSLKESDACEFEMILYPKNGNSFWVAIKLQPLFDQEEKLTGYFAILENRHEEKIAQDNVIESENRLSSLIVNLQAGLLLEDENRKVALTNKKFCEMFDVPVAPEMLKGVDCSQTAEQSKHIFKDSDEFVKRIDLILRERKTVLSDLLELKDGRFFERDYIPIFISNQYKGHLWTYYDITERKNHEKNLKNQEEKYRGIIANMNLALVETDMTGKIQYVNQRFCEISGYNEEDVLNNQASSFFQSHDGLSTGLLKNKLLYGSPDVELIPFKTKRGDLRWWISSADANFNKNGDQIGTINIYLDVTEQKQLEDDLLVAKLKAEESSLAKESFLANMSHEIRTPLNAIIGMVRELSKAQLDQKHKTYLKHASTASQHLYSIVNNILDISKISAGQLTLEQSVFRLSDVIKEVATIMQPAAAEKMIALNIDLPRNLSPAFVGDPIRIKQILLNIVSNSIKFTENGYVSVTCTPFEKTDTHEHVKVVIEDTGIGMESSYLKELFGKFTQEDSSTSRKYGGTGLGMSIAHELIQMMDGSIDVKSVKGKGTTFEVNFKFALGSESELEDKIAIESYDNLKNIKVLLVEDNELNRLVAVNSLANHHAVVVEAANGEEALTILKQDTFDVILMDLQMPVMDGLTAAHLIRHELNVKTPIIALTANAFKEEIEKCFAAGMNDYVTKPFEESTFFNAICKSIRNAESITNRQVNPTKRLESDRLYDLTKMMELSRGNKEFITKLIRLFVTQTPGSVREMHLAFENGDYSALGKVAHRIKPSVDNLGIQLLKNDIRLLEQATFESDPETISKVLHKTSDIIGKVVMQLSKEYLPK